MDQDYKVRENRIRRTLDRMGFKLHKNHARDPYAIGYGKYWVQERSTGLHQGGFDHSVESWTLDDVESWLADYRQESKK